MSLLRRRMIDRFQFSQNNLEARHPFYHFRSFNPRKFINCERRIWLIAILDMHLVKMLCLPIRKKPCSPKRLCFSIFILASMLQEVLKSFFAGPQRKDLCFHHKKGDKNQHLQTMANHVLHSSNNHHHVHVHVPPLQVAP